MSAITAGPPTAVALASAAAAAAILTWSAVGHPARRLPLTRSQAALTSQRPRLGRLLRLVPVALLLGVLAAWYDAGAHVAVASGVAAATAWAAGRLAASGRSRAAARRRRGAVIALCDALAAELRGGLAPEEALRRSCRHEEALAPIARAAELGADVPAAMRAQAGLPGLGSLRLVAAGWQTAVGSGAGLADVLERLSDSLRADADADAEVEAALGPPRATARMLAVLPVFGLLLGSSMGGNPVAFLLTTSWGLACLTVGVALSLLGVWWVDRIAAAVQS